MSDFIDTDPEMQLQRLKKALEDIYLAPEEAPSNTLREIAERALAELPIPPYAYHDGFKRTLGRMAYEAKTMGQRFITTLKEFVTLSGGPKDIAHNFVDIFVETIRPGVYLIGHVLALGVLALVVGALAGMVL